MKLVLLALLATAATGMSAAIDSTDSHIEKRALKLPVEWTQCSRNLNLHSCQGPFKGCKMPDRSDKGISLYCRGGWYTIGEVNGDFQGPLYRYGTNTVVANCRRGGRPGDQARSQWVCS